MAGLAQLKVRMQLVVVGAGGVGAGWALAQLDRSSRERALPSGGRACCDGAPLTAQQRGLVAELRRVVGDERVREGVAMRGARIGRGTALAFVQPASLGEAALALRACADAGAAVVPQGANTGLTGGSVPSDESDRPAVVLSLRGLAGSRPVDGAERVLCLAGTGIADLASALRPLGREGHSVLGSYFLNPTVGAGVALGSGGTQLRKGPVFTERGLYLAVDAAGSVVLVNELGLDGLADGAYELDAAGLALLATVDGLCAAGAAEPLASSAAGAARAAHATGYGAAVTELDGRVARCNADTSGPPYVRSEGKVLLLASVHQTFAAPTRRRVLWVSTGSLEQAAQLKRALLQPPAERQRPRGALLPASLEYLDASTVAAVDGAGRALIAALGLLGMDGGGLALGWRLKSAFEALPLPLAPVLLDGLLFGLNGLMPDPLPPAVRAQAGAYGHHLLVELCDYGQGEDTEGAARVEAFARGQAEGAVAIYECPTGREGLMLQRFRFAVAPAFRTWCVGHGQQGLSLDYALPKDCAAAPQLPPSLRPTARLRYSHYGCNVVHEDLAFAPGVDTHAAKMEVKRLVEAMGGKLPAEHGHGTEYAAPAATRARWMAADPTNTLNPGVGGLSHCRGYECGR